MCYSCGHSDSILGLVTKRLFGKRVQQCRGPLTLITRPVDKIQKGNNANEVIFNILKALV